MRLFGYVALVVIVTISFNSWVLSPEHYFFADDWGWLSRAEFMPWQEFAHLLPQSIYNDRPAGEIFIRVMYKMFWLHYEPYSVLWLLMHVVNCVVLFFIAQKSLPPSRALICALLAACWFSTLAAVNWVGAIFDLAGALWCLLALLCYLNASVAGRHSWMMVIAAIVLHVLAIRTKEFALAMIVVFSAWDVAMLRGDDWRKRAMRLLPHIVVTVVYLVAYFHLYEESKAFVTTGSYEVSFSLSTILVNIDYYFAHAFYAFTPYNDKVNLVAGFVFCAVTIFVSCLSRVGIASLLSGAALLAAVLLLPKQQSALYLYAPHFFIAIALCAAFPRSRFADILTATGVVLLVAWPVESGYWRDARHFVLLKSSYSQTLFDDYTRIMHDKPRPDQVTIVVSDPYFDPFSWGSGSALKIYYADQAIKVDIIKQKTVKGSGCDAVKDVCFVESKGHLIRRK